MTVQEERLQALQMAGFHHHVFARIRLRSGGVKANFIFFIEKNEKLDEVFKTDEYPYLLLAHKNRTFHQMYLEISNWFFNHVIMHTLQKEADFFESFYGPRHGWNLNFIIYFTTKSGTQPLMFVMDILKFRVRNPRTGQMVIPPKASFIKGTPETRDFRIFVSLRKLVTARDQFSNIFFHEITHIFHPIETIFYRSDEQLFLDFERMKMEGLATLTEIASNTSSHMNEHFDIFRSKSTKRIYDFGFYMWLVIYLSKINIRLSLDLTQYTHGNVNIFDLCIYLKLQEHVLQYMQGNYRRIFYAWFMRFRQFTNGQFLEQYLEGARKLGLGIILEQETIASVRGNKKFYYTN